MGLHLNIKEVLISLFFSCMLLLQTSCHKETALEIGKLALEQDTVWQGTIIVSGDIYVPPGVTLTIQPATTVKFKRIDETSDRNLFDVESPYYPQAELIIRGRIIARGTKKEPIVFTSAEIDARPADWGAINLLGSDDNIIEYVKILFAYNGIHAHGSTADVAHSQFANNGVGISFKSEEETPGVPWFGRRSDLTITDNLFYRNKGGVGFRNSDARISHNEMKNNKFFGIWPKENVKAVVTFNEITDNKKGVILYQTRGLNLTNNNIYDNTGYNIAVAEAQDFDIDASQNWFGTINEQKIEELIFDHQDDPDLGEVKIKPILERAVQWEQP